jgi:hypothetical protein
MTSDVSLDTTSKTSFAYKEENNIAKNCAGTVDNTTFLTPYLLKLCYDSFNSSFENSLQPLQAVATLK